ncbi:MAG: hypothetical protein J7576_15520 [Siphonobacter aquaeclarae]|nr:hypothetical protein [Siphonobacter aquaeclarae]
MDLTNELLTDIARYLDGTMQGPERDAFAGRMESEDGLRLEVQLQQEIREGMKILAEKERFKAIHAEVIGATAIAARPVRRLPWRPLAIAASLALLLGIGWWWWAGQATDRYLAAGPKPEPVLLPDDERLGASPERHTADSLALTAALSTLRNTGAESAIPALEKVASQPLNHWTASAEWYLAIAYRKEGRKEDARRLLERIAATEGHPYQAEAAKELR